MTMRGNSFRTWLRRLFTSQQVKPLSMEELRAALSVRQVLYGGNTLKYRLSALELLTRQTELLMGGRLPEAPPASEETVPPSLTRGGIRQMIEAKERN